MADAGDGLHFRFFNEIGIIAQLSRAMFEARLPAGIGVPQFAVLNHLVRVRDGQTPLALARAFQAPKTTMTHTLGLLERGGLIEVRPNPRDQRSKQVWLTGEGRAFREAAIRAIEPDLVRLSAAIPKQTIIAALNALEEVRRFLDEDRERPSGDAST